jgi:hypothetical protein
MKSLNGRPHPMGVAGHYSSDGIGKGHKDGTSSA